MIFYIANNTWCGTQADAKAIDRNFTQFDVPTDKAGLLAFLNEKQDELNVLREGISADEPAPAPSPISRSVAIDDEFLNLSVPHQLTLATLALENAREAFRN